MGAYPLRCDCGDMAGPFAWARAGRWLCEDCVERATARLDRETGGRRATEWALRGGPSVAWLMPLVVSLYAAVAAVIAAVRPKGMASRRSAQIGAGAALGLAAGGGASAGGRLHGHVGRSGGRCLGVPPLVVAHMMHLAATPATAAAEADTVAEAAGADLVAVPVAEAVAAPVAGGSAGVPAGAVTAPGQVAGRVGDVAGVAVLPGLDWPQVAGGDGQVSGHLPGQVTSLATRAAAGGRRPEQVRAAVAALEAAGRPVTGQTVGEALGVAERTGRRYLAALDSAARPVDDRRPREAPAITAGAGR